LFGKEEKLKKKKKNKMTDAKEKQENKQTQENKQELKLGKYKHVKGKLYEVIGIARHSDTLEELVVYKALYHSEEFGNNALWVRPKKMFLETVEVNGKKVPRFEYLGN
jgi:hypothetical protein